MTVAVPVRWQAVAGWLRITTHTTNYCNGRFLSGKSSCLHTHTHTHTHTSSPQCRLWPCREGEGGGSWCVRKGVWGRNAEPLGSQPPHQDLWRTRINQPRHKTPHSSTQLHTPTHNYTLQHTTAQHYQTIHDYTKLHTATQYYKQHKKTHQHKTKGHITTQGNTKLHTTQRHIPKPNYTRQHNTSHDNTKTTNDHTKRHTLRHD